jgi:hypothetical protein
MSRRADGVPPKSFSGHMKAVGDDEKEITE